MGLRAAVYARCAAAAGAGDRGALRCPQQSVVSYITNLLRAANSAGLPSRRWIYEQLFSHDAPLRPEREIVEDGVLEVDGPPPDGRESWRRGELCGDLEHLGGHRRVRVYGLGFRVPLDPTRARTAE